LRARREVGWIRGGQQLRGGLVHAADLYSLCGTADLRT
jgi:hypothetical protein